GKGVSGMKQREADFVNEMFISSTHDHILFISNYGMMYRLKCYEIPEGSRASRGFNIVNLLPLKEGEKIAAMLRTKDFDEGKYLVTVTRQGKIKRTALSAYKNVRKNGLIAVGLEEGDEIAGVRLTDGAARIFVATKQGMILRMEETCIRPQGRSAHGVKAITLRDGDAVVSIAREREGASLLTVTENGYGRRSELEQYRIQNRGGYGLHNYKVDEERGTVCGIKVVDETDDILLISSDGIVIRVCCADIRLMGRTAKGVRIMRVTGENRVVAFSRTEHDENEACSQIEDTAEETELELADDTETGTETA
ncbi:MAG: DNA gyrase C-terminal beta-propeller domain-containing protein, partial [Oscillospiraceae bacterium]|nr:DNA gyrase C-terminal beta-propeller domain-containing protein [Oscillospiraceae bacterium]